jgi:predicted nucleic acid-binding protein
MKIIVDSNVVVSAILNKHSRIGELLIFGRRQFEFFAPTLVKSEIEQHQLRLIKISKLSEDDFERVREELFECLTFVQEEEIPYSYWHQSLPIVREVDMDDIAFVALAAYLDGRLWTGDKRLLAAMEQKGYTYGVSTQWIYNHWLSIR